jgi:ADP-ribosylation factor-like protein 1
MMCDPELAGAILLVLANKRDVPSAADVAEVSDALQITALGRTHACVLPTSAATGYGVADAMRWLATTFDAKEWN